MQRSRYRLGPIRLLPKFSIREAGYDNNILGAADEKVSDWTATVSAGARWILPIGSESYLRGDAMPEYIWYARLAQGRTLGGKFSASLLGLFSRISVEANASASKRATILNSESETRVIDNLRDGSVNVEIDLLRRLSVFAGGQTRRHRYTLNPGPPDLLNVKQLDRTDSAAGAGIRYRFLTFFDISAKIEGTQSDFLGTARERDNRSIAYLLGVHYDRERLFINLSAGYRRGRPHNGSAFPGYSTTTGAYFVSYFLARPIEFQVYGQRGATDGLFLDNPYYFETRNGGGVNVRIRRRLLLRGYGEYGTNQYAVPVLVGGAEIVKRLDKATTVGGGFSMSLFRNATLTALVSRTNYSTNIPGFGRSVLRYTTGFSIEGAPSR